MGVTPPFLYDPPSHTRNDPYAHSFNPKAVSQLSLQQSLQQHSPPRSPIKQGPLIDFNRHPDSWVIPATRPHVKPMSRRTRKNVAVVRKVLLALRCVEVLAAMGMLIAGICVRGQEGIIGWIMRVPPGIAILHCSYAIYHLAHRPTSRTPASSSAYFFFSLFLSVSLLPLLAYTALLAHAQRYADPGPPPWTSVFPNKPMSTDTLIFALFIIATINAGFHLLTAGICLYLGLTFRTISKMPPDMNPLEDNLTSRSHKKKNSDMSFLTDGDRTNNRFSQATTASVTSFAGPTDPRRGSQATFDQPPSSSRTVPFMQTRADLPSQSPSHRHSQTSLARRSTPPRSPTKRAAYVAEHTPPRQNHPLPTRPSMMRDHWEASSDRLDAAAPTRTFSDVSSMKEHEILLAENDDAPAAAQLLDDHEYHEQQVAKGEYLFYERNLHPLHANPPTPPPISKISPRNHSSNNNNNLQPLHPTNIHPPSPLTTLSPNHPHSPTLSLDNTPTTTTTMPLDKEPSSTSLTSFRAKFYGDLKSATPPIIVDRLSTTSGSVRAGGGVGAVGLSGSRPGGFVMGGKRRGGGGGGGNDAEMMKRKRNTDSYRYSEVPLMEEGDDDVHAEERRWAAERERGGREGRVLSNSGREIGNVGARRREVSGKVVEEGRGGRGGGWW
ncbi:MAG: hypothetical protein M1817_003283 [Caeruleum heppii]|nr:MAG: hypothetical protein M1817_003283 [Caeruleum heppii]